MPPNPSARAYRSIFLSDNWAHQRHYGWRCTDVRPGLRLLERRQGPVRRVLILLTREGRDGLDNAVSSAFGRLGLCQIIIHDFDHCLESMRPVVDGLTFSSVETSDRLLNIATYAVDLEQAEDVILGNMTSNYRREIRSAAVAGVQVVAHDNPDGSIQAEFLGALEDFARPRGLRPVNSARLQSMYSSGDATLFVASKDGRATNYAHIYKAGNTGLFMYGINLSKANDGAGKYLHWQIMRRLKAEGFGWYDFGGVAEDEGIRRFKERFGGQHVDLGIEWRATGGVARLLVYAQRLRRIWR